MRTISFLLLFCPLLVFSQNKEPGFHISTNGHYGFIIPHYPDMRYFVTGHVPGIEVDFVVPPKTGQDECSIDCLIPERGIGLSYFNLGNPEILGSGIGVLPFANFKIHHAGSLKLLFRVGSGLGIITKPFDRIENHKEYAIGSYLNAFMNLRLNTYFNISENLRMETGLGISHFSNGAFVLPNLGINIATFNLGFALGCRPKKTIDIASKTSPGFIPCKHFTVYFTGGLKEISPPEGKKYPCFNLSFNREKKFSPKGKYSWGLETTYNGGNYAEFKKETVSISHAQNIQVGIKAGYFILAGKLIIPIEMGAYLYSIEKDNGLLFHRIGLRYQLNEDWALCYTLKTHWAKADFIEFGFGYSFHHKKPVSETKN